LLPVNSVVAAPVGRDSLFLSFFRAGTVNRLRPPRTRRRAAPCRAQRLQTPFAPRLQWLARRQDSLHPPPQPFQPDRLVM